jgi:hypothetical protein
MRLLLFVFLGIMLNSCSQPSQNKIPVKTYFDLKSYFEKEADQLNRLNLKITKYVSVNGKTEQKAVKIADFNDELSSFINADINKAAWKNEFKVTQENDITTYVSENEKIPVKKLTVEYQNNKVASIYIVIKVDNMLYHSTDTLTYKPNQYYEIKKTQKIKLLEEKKYTVNGKLNAN